MGETTTIAWTDATFNPWLGCSRVSEGCRHCYAETFVTNRMGLDRWGTAPRVRTKLPWRDVLRWNKNAEAKQVRTKVFCASLCDVFEDAPGLLEIRADLWPLIEKCTWLDWQLLTKRPENIKRMIPTAWRENPMPNVWLGTSCENQETANERVRHLLSVRAAVRFLSCEPLLGPINLRELTHEIHPPDSPLKRVGGNIETIDALRGERTVGRVGYDCPKIDWVIVGGESGKDHRPMDLAWARDLWTQCKITKTAYFFNQTSGPRSGLGATDLAGERIQEFPR